MRCSYAGVLTRQLPAASRRRTVAMLRQLPLGMRAARELQPQMRQATNTIITTFDVRAPCNTARMQLVNIQRACELYSFSCSSKWPCIAR